MMFDFMKYSNVIFKFSNDFFYNLKETQGFLISQIAELAKRRQKIVSF